MNENQVELLRAEEIEAKEEFDAAQELQRRRRAELGITAKATAPVVGPQERHELQRLTREVARAGDRWRGRTRARKKAEVEVARARVRAASNLDDQIEALDAELQELMPLAYRPANGERCFELRKKRAAMMAEYNALLEREIAEVKNAT